MIDQDQSDNVTTQYLLNANGQTAQDNAANAAAPRPNPSAARTRPTCDRNPSRPVASRPGGAGATAPHADAGGLTRAALLPAARVRS